MKGYVFDPRRLACSPEEQERRGAAFMAELLRGYLSRPTRSAQRLRAGGISSPGEEKGGVAGYPGLEPDT